MPIAMNRARRWAVIAGAVWALTFFALWAISLKRYIVYEDPGGTMRGIGEGRFYRASLDYWGPHSSRWHVLHADEWEGQGFIRARGDPIWPASIPGMVVVLVAVFLSWEARTPGQCPRCGYDLDGLPRGAACPECGRSPRETGRNSRD
jgi:hypothetical protein